ncbi:MAG: AAA family ATPase, partial [Spirochaetales bacterium]|nr:AAA family ATPase [Spirochaetales bacterium]MCF7937116.1 AAA family ATPase [Spirochaetales bacterium]
MNLVNLVFPIPVKRSYIYRVPDDWEPIPVGCRVTAPLGRRNLTGYSVKGAGEAPDGIELKFVQRRVDSEPLFDEEYLALAEWVAERYLCSLGEALSAMLPGARREQREEAGVLVEEPDAELRHTLTADQQEAVETLWSGSGSFYYLHGVTGSGKTEVYLRVAEKVLEQGRGVIYLVPEISLTYRLSEELAARFGPRVALLHSGLTPSRRLREWRMIQSRPDVLVVGARSAV